MTLLDKPYNFRRNAAQQARNLAALQRLLDGDLAPGELFGLVTGQSPKALTDPAMQLVTQRGCLDCAQPLRAVGEPLRSQPRRCRVCGSRKRQQHNVAYALRSREHLDGAAE